LIAFDALIASIYFLGKWSEFVLFMGTSDLKIPLSNCFFYQIVAHFAHYFSKIAMLYIGFDRVLAVFCPIW